MKTNIRYILLCALQDRLFYGLLALIIVIAGISNVLGGTAFIEHPEMIATYTAGASRLVLVMTAIVFVCFYVKSSFDHKHMDVMLSRPVSRDHIVLSHWLGFAALSVFMVLPVSAIFLLFDTVNSAGVFWWSMSMMLELWIVVAFSLFASLIMKSAVISVLASLAFYTLSRMMILFVMTAERSAGSSSIPFLPEFLDNVSLVIPRVDLFSKSEWLIHGTNNELYFYQILSQAALYITLLVIMCMLDFRKKQF